MLEFHVLKLPYHYKIAIRFKIVSHKKCGAHLCTSINRRTNCLKVSALTRLIVLQAGQESTDLCQHVMYTCIDMLYLPEASHGHLGRGFCPGCFFCHK